MTPARAAAARLAACVLVPKELGSGGGWTIMKVVRPSADTKARLCVDR